MPEWMVETTGSAMAWASSTVMGRPSVSPVSAVTFGAQKILALVNQW
jgi:hypothetical protein